jgi:hypothetical protein
MVVDAMAFRGAPGRSRNTYDIDATENENLAGRDSFRGVREEMAVALRRGWRSAAPADFPLSLPRPKKLKQKRRRRSGGESEVQQERRNVEVGREGRVAGLEELVRDAESMGWG